MAKYTPHTPQEVEQMLATVGVATQDELFADIPHALRIEQLNLDNGIPQQDALKRVNMLASLNKQYSVVLAGGGVEDHYIPPVVSAIARREEFVTAYTPYQPEISQGVLQSIFEYQSLMCALTGMDASNASCYDGASALAEAIVMCCERKHKAVLLGAINPNYLAVVNTYAYAHNIEIVTVPHKNGLIDCQAAAQAVDEQTACVVIQNPNYYGLIENVNCASTLAKQQGAKLVYAFHPIAAALLPTPSDVGADVAVAEGQPLGLNMYYGGCLLGIMTTNKAMLRRMPGRIVGQTTDDRGNRAFVLTLQAREQHIKRERATSSICSNQAHNAFCAGIYLNCVGKQGLVEVAQDCVDKAHYLAQKIVSLGGKLKYEGEFFHEFVTVGGKKTVKALAKLGVLGGIEVEGGVLWCVTEKADKESLDLVAKTFAEVEV